MCVYFSSTVQNQNSNPSVSVADTSFLWTFRAVHDALVLTVFVRAGLSSYLANTSTLFAENAKKSI